MQALGQLITSILTLLNLGVPTDNIITIALLLFVLMLGLFAINQLRRRTTAMDQQRVATLIKGLHFAGIAHDVLATARTNARDHLLRGLRWLMASGGLSAALYGSAALQSSPDRTEAMRAALVGVVPGAIGLAHLVFSWICSRGGQQPGSQVTNVARRR
jgi:hypothetical protein